VEAHAADLRDEADDPALAGRVKKDWRSAGLGKKDAALCAYAEKLTLAPAKMARADVDALRAAGLSDRAVHDAAQVIGYFNYINRIADGLGVDLEEEMKSEREKP